MTIRVTATQDAGLILGLPIITDITIPVNPLGSGAFGAVYPCTALGTIAPPGDWVVKVFEDGSPCRPVIQELVSRIATEETQRRRSGLPSLNVLPGLAALPLFFFTGTLNSRPVAGYIMRRLDTLGLVPVEELASPSHATVRQQYLNLPLSERLIGAAAFAEAMTLLHTTFGFIHCDLNEPNLWLCPDTGRMVVADFDSGRFLPSGASVTFGKVGPFLAPETATLLAQAGTGATPIIGLDEERWSVLIAVSYALFLAHPLFFLNTLAPDVMQDYLTTFTWPDVDPAYAHFQAANAAAHQWLVGEVAQLPLVARAAFQNGLHSGAFQPVARPSASDWHTALQASVSPPQIAAFSATPSVVASGALVRLSWQVTEADTVSISPGVGLVSAQGSVLIQPVQTTTYTLVAQNTIGATCADCAVQITSVAPAASVSFLPGDPAKWPPVFPLVTVLAEMRRHWRGE